MTSRRRLSRRIRASGRSACPWYVAVAGVTLRLPVRGELARRGGVAEALAAREEGGERRVRARGERRQVRLLGLGLTREGRVEVRLEREPEAARRARLVPGNDDEAGEVNAEFRIGEDVGPQAVEHGPQLRLPVDGGEDGECFLTNEGLPLFEGHRECAHLNVAGSVIETSSSI